jgi:hypothetical protein
MNPLAPPPPAAAAGGAPLPLAHYMERDVERARQGNLRLMVQALQTHRPDTAVHRYVAAAHEKFARNKDQVFKVPELFPELMDPASVIVRQFRRMLLMRGTGCHLPGFVPEFSDLLMDGLAPLAPDYIMHLKVVPPDAPLSRPYQIIKIGNLEYVMSGRNRFRIEKCSPQDEAKTMTL